MANADMPDELPIRTNGEGPDDTGVTPGAVTPHMPTETVQGGADVAQQVDEMEQRVLKGASPEVQEAMEEIDQENPGPNQELEGDENPHPDRDEPA